MAAVCVPSISLAASRTHDSCQPLLTEVCKSARQQPTFCLGNTDSPFIFKDPLHIGRCSPFHSTKVSDLHQKGVAV